MKHIFVVDDEKNIRHLIRKEFSFEGFEVVTAASGEEGLKLFSSRMFDMVLLDIKLPGMSGIEFLKQVIVTFPHILTIMLTGRSELEIAVQAINETGVYKFIQKPWDDDDLKITIKRALESLDLVSERDMLLQKMKKRTSYLAPIDSHVCPNPPPARHKLVFLRQEVPKIRWHLSRRQRRNHRQQRTVGISQLS